jgi:hypothetical protein
MILQLWSVCTEKFLNIDVAFGIFVHRERGNIIVIGGSGTNAASACSLKI